MVNKNVVKELLKHGILATPDVIKKIEEVGIDEFLSQKKKNSVFLTDVDEGNDDELIVEIKKQKKPKKLNPLDFIKYYNNRYEGIKNILLEKTDAVSINKISGFGEVSVIGMVRELLPDGFVLEDTTGKIDVVSTKKPSIDDVINVKGFLRDSRVYMKEIIYPDIPINRKIKNPDIKIMFLTKNNDYKNIIKKHKHDIVFIFSTKLPENLPKNIKTFLIQESPYHIKIKKGKENFYMIFYKPKKPTGSQEIKQALKKRHLSPERDQITGPEDVFLIKNIPNCLVVFGEKQWSDVYKGVLLISLTNNTSCLVDAKTGIVNFL